MLVSAGYAMLKEHHYPALRLCVFPGWTGLIVLCGELLLL